MSPHGTDETNRREAAGVAAFTDQIYDELRRRAHFQLARGPAHQTLDTTSLVHEAYLKLAAGRQDEWRDRAAAAQAMRHILVDGVRRRLSARRGGGRQPETLDELLVAVDGHETDILAIDQALESLRQLDDRLCRVVECRVFAGMTEAETARALGVSSRTVHRDWLRARGWLRRHLGRSGT